MLTRKKKKTKAAGLPRRKEGLRKKVYEKK